MVHTPRLALRCLQPSDASAVLAAITESLDELRPYLPWAAAEPVSLEEKSKLLRKFHRNFVLGREFCYGIQRRDLDDEERLIGCCGMHRRIGSGAIELGYWIHSRQSGRGYATEAAGELTRLAFDLAGMRRVEIHCDPRNLASAAIARKLGFHHIVTVNACVPSAAGPVRDTMIFAMSRP